MAVKAKVTPIETGISSLVIDKNVDLSGFDFYFNSIIAQDGLVVSEPSKISINLDDFDTETSGYTLLAANDEYLVQIFDKANPGVITQEYEVSRSDWNAYYESDSNIISVTGVSEYEYESDANIISVTGVADQSGSVFI